MANASAAYLAGSVGGAAAPVVGLHINIHVMICSVQKTWSAVHDAGAREQQMHILQCSTGNAHNTSIQKTTGV